MNNTFVGFKAFNKNLINRYGKIYELNKIYHTKEKIKFGINGNGFHMCRNLEDTLRYYDSFNNDIEICLVLGYGNFESYCDDYYGYYNMFAFESMYIIKILSRNEIINYMKTKSSDRIKRFISLYKMNEEEYNIFRNISVDIDNYIDYYQLNKKDVFKKKYHLE